MCSAQAGMLTTYPLSRASLPSLPPEPISKRTSGDATAPRGRRRRRVSPAQLEPDGHRGPRRRGALHGREDRWSGEGGSAEVDPDRRSADVWVLPPRGIYVDWPPVRHSIPSWRQWAVPLEQHADPTQEFTRGINAVNPMPTLLSVLWATEVPLNRNVDHPTTDGVGDRVEAWSDFWLLSRVVGGYGSRCRRVNCTVRPSSRGCYYLLLVYAEGGFLFVILCYGVPVRPLRVAPTKSLYVQWRGGVF